MKRAILLSFALILTANPQQRRGAYRFPRVELAIEDFQASGPILDIGGGGEGIIGLLKHQQVVAIDPSESELIGAPRGPLKIVMDAADMKFTDGSFDTATAFFSLMYMPPKTQQRVFAETHRILRPGGRFLIWDATIPTALDDRTEFVVFLFHFKLPRQTVTTGYGTPWPARPLDLPYYRTLAETAGFRVVAARPSEATRTFFLELRKS
jgi:ubiquinone/menaquinone biosynthesis C-methylase UbiE